MGGDDGWTGTEREDPLWYFTWCQRSSSLSLFPSPPRPPPTNTHVHDIVICLRISRLLHLWWPCVVGRGWVESVSFLNYSPTRNLTEFSSFPLTPRSRVRKKGRGLIFQGWAGGGARWKVVQRLSASGGGEVTLTVLHRLRVFHLFQNIVTYVF